MNDDLSFRVYGEPVPQGSTRAFLVGKGENVRAVTTHTNKRTMPWREMVKQAALDARREDDPPIFGPVYVAVHFYLPKPKSAPKRKRTWPTKRPDLDKLVRAVLDALGDAGVYLLDAQVVELHASKHYIGDDGATYATPGAHIFVHEEEE